MSLACGWTTGSFPDAGQLLRPRRRPGAAGLGITIDRDRAVDETGHQIGVFGRIGARPLNFDEQRKMYLRNGKPWVDRTAKRQRQAGFKALLLEEHVEEHYRGACPGREPAKS
jgi:hypothetical protein